MIQDGGSHSVDHLLTDSQLRVFGQLWLLRNWNLILLSHGEWSKVSY